MRAIDADALIPMMKYATTDSEIGVFPIKIGFNDIEKVINEQPTIEPERKKGRWVDKSNGIEGAWNYCSVCGEQAIDLYDFCPNCGADMKEGEADG